MASDVPGHVQPHDDALSPLAPGPLVRIASGALAVDIAPTAGGRLAQITFEGVPWLVGHDSQNPAMIAWGSYPMLPWAGRIRHGQFHFLGQRYRLPLNLGGHAIHGVGFGMPWQVDEQAASHVSLSLQLPEDERWPFGGTAQQRIEIGESRLRLTLTITAGAHPMPATIGWHPWFRKPERLDFEPSRIYPRDAEGIASLPLAAPPPGPWDDCFLNDKPVRLHRDGQSVRLSSDCRHWVVYDETAHATCAEPQSGPPDAFNLAPAQYLTPGSSISAWFLMEWEKP
ncbi:aldose 1-epimerase [Dyella humicola]|uniref:aldose 1-epimerase n=1 Tax=Dyella humicola TaxID=2992126 RepID=UPI002258A2AA|nr:aldose epimerase [Dyella humicola]